MKVTPGVWRSYQKLCWRGCKWLRHQITSNNVRKIDVKVTPFGLTSTRPTQLLFCNGFVANFIYFSAIYSLIGLSFRHDLEKWPQPTYTFSIRGKIRGKYVPRNAGRSHFRTFGTTSTSPTQLLFCNGFVANFIYFSAIYSLIGLSFRHDLEKWPQATYTFSIREKNVPRNPGRSHFRLTPRCASCLITQKRFNILTYFFLR